jgi:hypothetical protein
MVHTAPGGPTRRTGGSVDPGLRPGRPVVPSAGTPATRWHRVPPAGRSPVSRWRPSPASTRDRDTRARLAVLERGLDAVRHVTVPSGSPPPRSLPTSFRSAHVLRSDPFGVLNDVEDNFVAQRQPTDPTAPLDRQNAHSGVRFSVGPGDHAVLPVRAEPIHDAAGQTLTSLNNPMRSWDSDQSPAGARWRPHPPEISPS